eukprot:CAMPEP_0113661598 /NCGR_PEP_ID=MMETSP0038_2-20120614/65_1 /TAXON_ID=2898 /ORGANISM="Cryptomonas paramecium" /LENGTH=384 /DNA_ID=CAMNT_0000576311 /DNA_START=14 /DNA_END=1166 /DNA_ORIENTATION=- /assembly_acc=CAM_ASM_000170
MFSSAKCGYRQSHMLVLTSAIHLRFFSSFLASHTGAGAIGLTEHKSLKHSSSTHGSSFANAPSDGSLNPSPLHFTSSYVAPDARPHGFCNWLIPGRLMAGRYPHVTPYGSKTGSPTTEEAVRHLRRLAAAGVNTYVCLQAEVPPQDDAQRWSDDGSLDSLQKMGSPYRKGFQRYAGDAAKIAAEDGHPSPRFIQHPVEDFGVPKRPNATLQLIETLAEQGTAASSEDLDLARFSYIIDRWPPLSLCCTPCPYRKAFVPRPWLIQSLSAVASRSSLSVSISPPPSLLPSPLLSPPANPPSPDLAADPGRRHMLSVTRGVTTHCSNPLTPPSPLPPPPRPNATLQLIETLAEQMLAGAAVPYVHCWGGRGRTGTLGACLLVAVRGG